MASIPNRELKIGEIIDKALAVLERAVMPALIFFVAFTAVNGVIAYFTATASPMSQMAASLLKIVVAVFFTYQLLNAMVERTGLRSRGDTDVFLSYFGLAVLYALGVLAGFILLIIPAFFLIARWSLAQPLVVARGDGIRQAFGESWERTRGNEFQIIVAVFVLVILPQAVSVTTGLMFPKGNLLGITLSQILASVSSVLSLAMSAALYGMIVGVPKDVAATFE